jgi:hypothetical protein
LVSSCWARALSAEKMPARPHEAAETQATYLQNFTFLLH